MGVSGMNKIKTKLATVQVSKGQGVGEGDFELRLEEKDDSHSIIWPAPNSSAKTNNNGPAFTFDEEVATYTVNGPVTKQYTILATEVDRGLNGLDDYGTGAGNIDLTPNMSSTTKWAVIDLSRHRGGDNGQIKIGFDGISGLSPKQHGGSLSLAKRFIRVGRGIPFLNPTGARL